jgi:hypothetical protein
MMFSSFWAQRILEGCLPHPPVFLRKRVHKVMKTKDRRCKKVQRVRILLRTLQIARIADTKRFWEHGYTPTPCFGEKRLEGIENKGSHLQRLKKEAGCGRKHCGRFCNRVAEINSWRWTADA